jgi:hypothetical protein
MAARTDRPDITPDMKVNALLDAYPELEEVLIGIAPAFKKLRNPILRKTVAKLTSLRQAAQVGGVSLGEMIGRLRKEAGVEQQWSPNESTSPDKDTRPQWLETGAHIEIFDARQMIEEGGHPLPVVMSAVKNLKAEQIYAIVTPFSPAPMIDKVRESGFDAWCERENADKFKTYFRRKEN